MKLMAGCFSLYLLLLYIFLVLRFQNCRTLHHSKLTSTSTSSSVNLHQSFPTVATAIILV